MTGVSSREAESQMHGWHMCSSIALKIIYFWLIKKGKVLKKLFKVVRNSFHFPEKSSQILF